MPYELFYWPSIQGRGEFIRLALEDAGADYIDVARSDAHGGVRAMQRLLAGEGLSGPAPFAPPFLRDGELVISQTANILAYLGPRIGLAPDGDPAKFHAAALQLTLADFASEAHDTHHPVGTALYYEDQKTEALRAATAFVTNRIPKFLGYFERVLDRNAAHARGVGCVGDAVTYVDLSLFQVVRGLRYAFPRAMRSLEPSWKRVIELHDRVADRPRLAAYLASPRRLPFNEHGIFRHYAELDVEPPPPSA